MFSNLKKHPFAVEAFFEDSVVLTFAVPKEHLQALIPPCLELDTHQERWAFIAVAMVQTKDLRPKGFPKCLGHDFFLIGYRIFVRYTNSAGKKLRGLYIIKSETDRKKMEYLGNIFTQYSYTTTDIQSRDEGGLRLIESLQSKFSVQLDLNATEVSLPLNSPFLNWKEARRFAGPLPFTFSFDAAQKEVLIIEGMRENWTPAPLRALHYQFEWLTSLGIEGMVLANAFILKNIPYVWKRGKTEAWNS